MADKLSKGSSSSTFKNVSIDIGVIRMQGKGTETQKTVILTKKTNKKKNSTHKKKHTHTHKKKNTYQIIFEKKRFYVNS